MPNLEEHCQKTIKRYGVEGRDIHSWIDEPSKEYAGSHRQFRHDSETIRLVGEIFGKTYGKSLAENIALDHIMADHEADIRKRNTTIVVNLPEQKEIPSIPCTYCGMLLKPSDQMCPQCGASRTKIIEHIDRATEMEKLKLQEEKKELRKQLKIELKLREMSPYERLRLLARHQRIVKRDNNWTSNSEYIVLQRLIEEDTRTHPQMKKEFDANIAKDTKSSGLMTFFFVMSFLISAIELFALGTVYFFLIIFIPFTIYGVFRWITSAVKHS